METKIIREKLNAASDLLVESKSEIDNQLDEINKLVNEALHELD